MLQKKQSEEHTAEKILIKEMQPFCGAWMWMSAEHDAVLQDQLAFCYRGRPPETTFAP